MSNLTTNYLNSLGKDLLNVEKCRELLNERKKIVENTEKALDVNDEESKVGKVIKIINNDTKRLEKCLNSSEKLITDVDLHLIETKRLRSDTQDYIDKISNLECLIQYIKIIQRVERLSKELEKEILNDDDEKCATIFANLCDISGHLMSLNAPHIKQHFKETLYHWHEVLKEKFSMKFEDILKSLKWPFVNTNFSLQTPSPTVIQKLQIIAEYLLQIELPEESANPIITSALLSNFPPLSLPVYYLVSPLRKRFIYHFHGTRQTNRVDKPEWYFTQILSWIRDHVDFIEKYIQPIVDKLGLHHVDAKLEFMRGLVQLSVEKLHSDLPNLQFDDFVFSHSIDEALGFEKELREAYNYPPTQSSILAVLTQPHVFVKWKNMEKKYATEKMDLMLSPNSAFQNIISIETDEHKINQCADTFVTLLQTITERYELLQQPGHRLQFLELQLELLDDFRVRLCQLTNAETGNSVSDLKSPMIANTLYYIENVLIDWSNTLHFLSLYYYKSQKTEDFDDFEIEMETIFTPILSLYRHKRFEILSKLGEIVLGEVKTRSREYQHEIWSRMNRKHKDILSLTPSACPMFEVLGTRLHQLQNALSPKLFKFVWHLIAKQLDEYLYENLVVDTRFNKGGALQLQHDVTRNLFPLFSQFCEKPDNFFPLLNDTCVLLNLANGSALHLIENLVSLEGATGIEDQRGAALKDVGVISFTPSMALQILNQRADIAVDRLAID
ncbi:RAD50-interacting protein 1 [Onthophagus taurus]|uniref:RAD50-interacting protein 1 n=1 Tax=Onthophagus taurus TaxID=166361 RepID=UPI0039BE10EF